MLILKNLSKVLEINQALHIKSNLSKISFYYKINDENVAQILNESVRNGSEIIDIK